ncbi:MAG: hypothetical protein JKY19_08165 [Alcanivoracaceae bacterium]|nr:hypothetical protein [Alcanivoracaceae bacterium]
MTFKQLISISILLLLMITPIILQAKEKPIFASKRTNTAIKGYDSVAYFTENKAVKGSKTIAYKWHGAQWLFSSKEHLSLFINTPEKYAPQYGGWCAYAMSDGRAVAINPKAFEIYNDRLYLNYSNSVLGHWRKEKDQFIKQADGHYPDVVDISVLEKL